MKKNNFELEIERLLLSIARVFLDVSLSDIDQVIQSSLRSLVQFINVDRGYIYFFQNNNKQLELAYHFYQPDINNKIPLHDQVDSEDFSWLTNSLLSKKTVSIDTLSQFPPKASTIKLIMQSEKTKSMLLCPLINKNYVSGFIGLDSVREEYEWKDNIEYLLKTCGDIFLRSIERKKSIEWGKQSEEKLRQLFNRIEDGIFISTPKGKFIELNPAGVRMLGYSSEAEIIALNTKQDLYEHPSERKKFQKLLEKKGHIKDYELTLKCKSGKRIIVLITATAIYDRRGNIEANEGIIRNVTDKRNLERQLFQAQKMESIGLLAGGIAHDFNNILTAMNGYAEMMQMSIDKSNPLYKNVKNILKSGKRAESLIRQLLAFSRKQLVKLDVVDINFIISDLSKMLKRLIAADIKLELDLKEGLKHIKADTTQIQQILVNLMMNADHAIKELKGKNKQNSIKIFTDIIKITEKSGNEFPESMEGEFIVITVSDSGIGMDEKTKQKIYDPFFTTKKEGVGTGLGLSTVYGIVKQNNGYIFVESEPGLGSFFYIYWPVTKDEKESDFEIESEVRIGPRAETILVVEDELDVRELVCEALTTFGYNVIDAENGKQALIRIEEEHLINKIDLLLTDMVMPEMGGEELAEQVHRLNPEIKILLCSGYTQSTVFMSESPTNNKFFFITKPYTIQKLDKKIRKILDGSSVEIEKDELLQ